MPKWVAEYLLSNGKTLDMDGLPELSTYRDVSEEVEREDTGPRYVVANEIATYEPEDLAKTTALADQMNENQKEVFDQVMEVVKTIPLMDRRWFSWMDQLEQAPCFEAVDRSFPDIMKNDLEPFGGKVMVFSGDLRQILPVLTDATRAETLEACFKSSPQWNDLKKARLTENIRGRYPVNSDISENDICLPRDMCIISEERGHCRWDDVEHKESEHPQTLIFYLLKKCLLMKAILILTMIAESGTSTL
ncbi:Helitron helicase [Phytophthora megakarya]|uniref:ATP-dependent DNA helicase n=1 Tax=Phytophthora megakarya TaxID=4795 RepID=A0A225V277_9STRA|nr:Helitron helicase [Phytophthora megakarya]